MKQRILTAVLGTVLTAALCIGAAAAAAPQAGHWAEAALNYAMETGMLEESDLRGEEPATRADLAVMVTRLLGLGAQADLSVFPDVSPEHPEAEALGQAVALGLLQGSDGLLLPDETLTREQAFVILSRSFALPCGDTAALDTFRDSSRISAWARPGTTALVSAGFARGSNGYLRPQDSISRQELAQLLLNLTRRICTGEGGTAILPAGAAIPEKLQIDGDLYLCTESDLTLKQAQISGRLVIRGSGTVTLQNCSVGSVQLCDQAQLRVGKLRIGAMTVHAAPAPEEPYLSVSLPVYGPDRVRQTAQLSWSLGGTPLAQRSLELDSSAEARLYETLDYTQELPAGALTATVTLGEDSLTITHYVNITPLPPPVVVETIRVEAAVRQGTGLFADSMLTQYIGWVSAGTEGIYTNYVSGKSSQLELTDGRSGWVDCRVVEISAKNYLRETDYTTAEKENYVNQSGYASPTDYLVWISLKTQRVNVFLGSAGRWKLDRSFTVATGKNSTPTIAGVFSYCYRMERWDFGEYYVRPVLGFNGGHAFHSRTYKPDGTLLDPTLGYPASAGCIRMRDEDVGWLDQHLPLHSTVVVY